MHVGEPEPDDEPDEPDHFVHFLATAVPDPSKALGWASHGSCSCWPTLTPAHVVETEPEERNQPDGLNEFPTTVPEPEETLGPLSYRHSSVSRVSVHALARSFDFVVNPGECNDVSTECQATEARAAFGWRRHGQ